MLLTAVKKENGWIFTHWELTYPAGWDSILNAAAAVYHDLTDPEVLTDRQPRALEGAKLLKELQESGTLTVRGLSGIFGRPIMLTFWNQTRSVEALIPADDGEFRDADYEAINRSMCQFMDSVELAIHRPDIFA